MTILIIKVSVTNDFETGEPTARHADFIIDNGDQIWYKWSRGGIPLIGNVQNFLDAEEAELYAAAVSGGRLATLGEIALAEARAWYIANPGAKADVFDKTTAQEDTDVRALVTASFPALGAAAREGWVRLLLSALWDTRYNAFEKGLVNGE